MQMAVTFPRFSIAREALHRTSFLRSQKQLISLRSYNPLDEDII